MRLLKYGEDGELTITSFDDNAIPPYAILSHTWGADTEEVTFTDLTKSSGKDKPGYKKIRFCGEQASKDGLEYFWIDTCCINKENQAKLSLAIDSMFRWYRNSARCYVYLADVSSQTSNTNLEPSLQRSRCVVEFFSREWCKLSDKISLKSNIHKVTAIPYEALEGAPLSQFSVEERFQWRQNRHTKLKEDAAYSLSSIFDVDIAPVYGEGGEEAFRQLHNKIQCLRDLYATDPRKDKKRIEETKGGLLADSYR
ncbi:hypothetical protein BDW02DRAFT_642224 [Decorospora gaudefroyi]|uniref:Heterokaryon incompatibility domain-containing protein n=1 Tax=Decorospora gaudefroyi TaxID=184978 RepID=A0A6A5K0G3_9PLEO|nr:hypothetical protein BDW02DRAFT_642224 [Decorospora gaudefroyi]